jgi:hypothetical protein
MRWLPVSSVVVFGLAFVFGLVVVHYTVGLPYAVQDADGDWRLTRQTDWLAAAVPAAFAAVAANGAWKLVRWFAIGRSGRSWPWLGVVLVAGSLLAGSLATLSVGGSIGCDGSVPRWMIPATYDGGGCVPWPANWQETQPWEGEDMVCLGMCGGE